MLDTDGFVSEASGENVFIVRRGRVKTHPVARRSSTASRAMP